MNKIYSFSKKMFALSVVVAASLPSNNLSAQVTQTISYTGAVQTFTVPICVSTITIDARGAQGGGSNGGGGGLGARMVGVYNVTSGTVYSVVVGQMGLLQVGGDPQNSSGGGGGTFVYGAGPTLLVAAGGGGGKCNYTGSTALAPASNGTTSTAGNGGYGTTAGTNGAGGVGGNGGAAGLWFGPAASGGGTGWLSVGGGAYGGLNAPTWAGGPGFCGGGAGCGGVGGFGGGGGGGNLYGGGGGGGGYSGGGGGTDPTHGGGGGSYSSGSNQNNTSGFQTGNGVVYISYSTNGSGVLASASSLSVCFGASTTLSASSVVSNTWSPGGSNSTSISVTPTINTTYTVQGTNSLGCISSAMITVTVDTGLPTLTVAASSTAVCAGKAVTYTASGATTYTWSGNTSVTNIATYTPALPGATYTVSGANACGTNSTTVSVVTNTIPAVTASINTPTVCSGNTVTIIGGGAVTYTWAGGFPNNSPFAPSATTNYSVTGTSAQGCTATAVTAVTVYITPNVPPAVTPTAICVGQTATLSATGATSYSWIPGVNLVTQSVVVSPAAPTTYTLYRDNSGCTSTANISLVVNALPIMSASGTPSNICAGQGANLVVVGPITNTWFPGPFTQSNFTVFPNSSRDYTVVGSNANCTISAVVSISVNPTPTLTVAYTSPTLCSGGTNNLTANGAITYTWMNGTNNLGNNQTISVSPPVTAQYILMGTNASGCTATVNPLVVVYALPNSNIVSSAPFICAGAPAILGVTVTPGSTFSWNTGAITPSITVSPTVTTNYNLTVTTSSTGCQSSSVFPLSVYIATYAITSPTAVCKGNTATITAVGAASNYTWMTGSTTVGTTSVISVSPQVTTVYNVTGSTGGCIYTRTVNLIVNPIPPVRATPDKNPMCYLDPVTIVASGANSYSWSTTSTLTAIDVSQQNITTTYTLTGTDLNGCSKTVTVTQFVATCTGIENYSSNNIAISVYPNPSNGNFFISSDVALDLSVVNTLGQEVSRFKADLNRKEIQLNNLPGGIYFITGQANGMKVNKKIIIDK